MNSSLAVDAQRPLILEQEILQFFPIGWTAGPATQAVDLELQSSKANRIEEVDQHHGDFGIDRRVIHAEDLDVDLVELPQSTLLGSFVTEHGPHDVELCHGVPRIETPFDVGPSD